MGRKFNNMVVKIFIYISIVCIFSMCKPSPYPINEDMIGSWEAEDGAIIKLNIDNTFQIKKFNSRFLFMFRENSTKQKIDAEGRWEISKDKDEEIKLKLSIEKYPGQDTLYLDDGRWLTGASTAFYIKSYNGFLNNHPKWFIRVIDNPDDYNIYDFQKIKQ